MSDIHSDMTWPPPRIGKRYPLIHTVTDLQEDPTQPTTTSKPLSYPKAGSEEWWRLVVDHDTLAYVEYVDLKATALLNTRGKSVAPGGLYTFYVNMYDFWADIVAMEWRQAQSW